MVVYELWIPFTWKIINKETDDMSQHAPALDGVGQHSIGSSYSR